jgi:uncharacterized membrane protein
MKDEAHKKSGPKDFFLNLGAIAAVYVSVISFLNLIFTTLNELLPDKADYYYNSYESMRWSVAYLLVAFPILLILTRILNKDIKKDPEKENIGIRKWLTYLTLFVTGAAVAVDLIMIINSFLAGEITLRFSLKVLAVLVTSVLVFGYYFTKIRGDGPKYEKIFMWTAILLAVSAIGLGFSVMGSPFTQRLMRLDEQKVSDLQGIQSQIVSYWQQREFLPEKLSDLNDTISGYVVPMDIDKETEYLYTIVSPTSFKLCAVFNLQNEYKNRGPEMSPYYYGANMKGETWAHGSGEYCYERKIDPTIYPPKSTPINVEIVR